MKKKYIFTKKEQNILKRAFRVETFNRYFYDKLMDMQFGRINNKLHKIGYCLKIKFKKDKNILKKLGNIK